MMIKESLSLIRPTADLAQDFHQMILEFRKNGEMSIEASYDRCSQDFPTYLKYCQDLEIGKKLPEGFVSSTTFWLVRNMSRVIGISHLRHHLSPGLKIEGGHIGYSIRPSERKKGYGTKQLNLVLQACRQFEMEKVMITCDFDNIGSIQIIENNGGIRTGEAISPRSNKKVFHYWITL